MDEKEAGSGEGTSRTVATEKGAMREALRDLLYEIPGFQALAERGIPQELISTPASVDSRGGPYEKAGESGGSRPCCWGKQGPAVAQIRGDINF